MTVNVIALTWADKILKGKKSIVLPDGGVTLLSLLEAVGLDDKSPFVYTINDKIAFLDSMLKDNDTVRIIPIISGG